MSKGGILIRLIDVAMIILFGFIAISDIKVRAQIKLPTQEQETIQENQPELYFVKISPDGLFTVEHQEKVLGEFRQIKGLENFLLTLFEKTNDPQTERVVIVAPHPDSMIQWTVDVLDICERHGLAKSIAY